ncbi:MAG: phytanoyl-CoA dioxygenase family protein [Gammaproteobacteria bacterium]
MAELSASDVSGAHGTRQLRADGYAIFKGVVPPDLIGAMREAVNTDYLRADGAGIPSGSLRVGERRFQISIDLYGPFIDPRVFANRAVMQVIDATLEDGWVIGDYTCVAALGGAPAMHVHRDASIFNTHNFAPLLPAYSVALLIPLVEQTADSGVTRLWPGSHRLRTTVDEVAASTQYIDHELRVGDALLMDSRLYHRGNANRTADPRPLLYLNYCNPWYMDFTNFLTQPNMRLSDANLARVDPDHRCRFVRRNIDYSRTFILPD